MQIEVGLVSSVALTLLLLLFGAWAARSWRIFSRFAIPGPVVGGFLFALPHNSPSATQPVKASDQHADVAHASCGT